MANRTRKYDPSDWSIWINQSETGSFIWDFSEWDSGDVWGTTGNTFSAVDLEIANITFQEGGSISQGIFSQITPNTLTATFNTKDFSTNLASKFLTGATIELRLKNENTTSLLDYTVYFIGFIENVSCAVEPGADFATITVSAISKTSAQLNTLVSITKNSTTEKGEILEAALSPYGLATLTDVNHFANGSTVEKTVGDWLQDALVSSIYYPTQAGYFSGLFKEFVNNGVGETFSGGVYTQYNNYSQYYDIVPSFNSQAVTGTFDETNTSNVQVGWSGEGAPTGVSLTLATDSAVTYKKNVTDNSGLGTFTWSGTLDVKNLTELTRIGNQLISMTKKFSPVQVTSVLATKYQDISFIQQDFTIHDSITFPAWFKVVGESNIGNQVGVELTNFGINDSMLVTGKTHEITPDNWTITYDLWKGFTA